MLRLKSITFIHTPRVPGLRPSEISTISCDGSGAYSLPAPLHGWRAFIRGAMLLLVSPPGWRPGINRDQWKPDGPCEVIEVPRTNCSLVWSADGPRDLEQISGKAFESEPFGPPPLPAPSLLDQLPPDVPPHELGDA